MVRHTVDTGNIFRGPEPAATSISAKHSTAAGAHDFPSQLDRLIQLPCGPAPRRDRPTEIRIVVFGGPDGQKRSDISVCCRLSVRCRPICPPFQGISEWLPR